MGGDVPADATATTPGDDGFQARGEPWRAMFGIDGSAGDAQDKPHLFVPDSPGGCCVVCGLARSYRKHTGDFGEVSGGR